MKQVHEPAQKALKRLLANGPLTGVPRRPDDQALLLDLAALRFEAHRTYREREVNEVLKGWLHTFCAPFGIDHVTMRRLMVDAGLLARDPAGSTYRIRPARIENLGAGRALDPARVLADIQTERAARKKRRAK